jgi:hypothetical protein
MTPQELLAEANRLLTTVVPGTRGRWPRACAWLIRLALEQSLDEFWLKALPDAANCSMRAQLLLLPAYAGEPTAARARDAWFGLAPAAHHHAYDLAPTAAELRRWHDLVATIAATLSSAAPAPTAAAGSPATA